MKKKKNILFITPLTYPHRTGGMEIFNYYLKNRLKENFNISYLAYKDSCIDGVKWKKLFSTRPIKYLIPFQTLFNLLLHPKTKMAVVSYSMGGWMLWYLYSWIHTLLRRDYIAVIHYGKSIATDGHNKRRHFFKNAYKVIAVSEDIKKNYDAAYGIDCEVLYPLVPFNIAKESKEELRAKYNIPADATVISMVGSIIPLKNPDTLLEALHLCTPQEIEQHNIHVVYAGGGSMLEDFKTRVSKSRYADRVHMLGIVPKENVNEIFKMSDMYVIASDFEGTSVSLLEAMYNSLPIMTSSAPGIIKTINEKNEALMFTTKNAEELKTHILDICNEPDLAKELSSAARKAYDERYSYDTMIDRYVQILNKEK